MTLSRLFSGLALICLLLGGASVDQSIAHESSGKNIQQIMQEELAEKQALEREQAEGKLDVTLNAIRFKGASLLSDEELQPIVAKFLNAPMNYEQMLDVGMAVELYYRQHNHLARVILPPQDLSAGVLELDVIESVVSIVEVDEHLVQLPNTEDHILALLKNQQPVGGAPNTQSVERDQPLANDVPSVSVQASLKEGQQAGDTELLLKMYQSRTKDLGSTFDNVSSRSTGAQRLMTSLSLLNPLNSLGNINLNISLSQLTDAMDAHTEGNSGKFITALNINSDPRHSDKVPLESPAYLRRPQSAGPHRSEWAQTRTREHHSRGSWWA